MKFGIMNKIMAAVGTFLILHALDLELIGFLGAGLILGSLFDITKQSKKNSVL